MSRPRAEPEAADRGGLRRFPNMETVDLRPAPLASGYREGLGHTPGGGYGPPTRDDLILARLARALGYAVGHRDGCEANSATFEAPGVAVWYAAEGWQARDLGARGHSGPRRVYGDRATSLVTALLREAPALLTHAPAPAVAG